MADYVRSRTDILLDELQAFLCIPSVSTLPAHRPDIERAVGFLAERLREIGFENVDRIVPAENPDGLPLLYADWLHAPGAPTVLFYGHYDVQPPDPLSEWKTPPFEPNVREGNIYARGAADDKGQVYAQIKAMQAWMQIQGRLPVNVRFLIEGEEEVGGESVEAFVRHHQDRLGCDCVVVSDTAMFAPGLPALVIGLRGMVYSEITVEGAERDLHSGLYGGVAPNPFEALVRILNCLKASSGEVLIPGFYDRVQPPSAEENAAWRRLPFDAEAYRKSEVRAERLSGESQYSVFERTWSRPTFDIHGMPGGFIGPGSKTVIPARAAAKVSMRLVPDQRASEIERSFQAAVQDLTPQGYRSRCQTLSLADPILISADSRFVQAAQQALRAVYGADPVLVRSGGSIPVVALFTRELRAPVVMMGFGLPDDGLHSPNEKFALSSYYGGIRAVAEFMGRLEK